MPLTLLKAAYFVLLPAAVVAGIGRRRTAGTQVNIYTGILAVTCLAECIAFYCAKVYHNNLVVYRIFGPLELLGYCLYFNYSVPSIRRWYGGWVLGICGLAAGVLAEYLYPQDNIGSHFLLVEGVTIICLCLYAFYCMLLREEDESPARSVHFWLVMSLTFFWCFSFISLVLYRPNSVRLNEFLNELILCGNIGMLTGVLYAFINLPKLQSWTAKI